MKQIYLVRHCETKEIDGEEIAHPRNDSTLSAKGFEQAELLAEHLCSSPIDLFLTSVFRRSVQTADVLKRARDIPIFSSAMLNEYFLHDDFQGAETTEQGLVRSIGFLNQFRPFFDNIAIVGHNSILATLYMSLLNMPFGLGKQSFVRAGTCRVLRYDISLGDENWREIDLFIPHEPEAGK